MEVEHVKAHCTEKDKKDMLQFETFVTEGNEKADELAKAGALLDEGFMAETRATTVQQEREEVHAAQPAVTSWWRNGKIVKSSNRSQKKHGFSCVRKGTKRSIERNGVQKPPSIDAYDVEEAVSV